MKTLLVSATFGLLATLGSLHAQMLINIDFGVTQTTSPGTWNNVTAFGPSANQPNLLNTAGGSTGIAMANSGFASLTDDATITPNSAMFDAFDQASVLRDNLYANNGATGTLAFTGLNPSLTYNLTITGARNAADARFTRYAVAGFGSQVLQTSGPSSGTGAVSYNNDDFVTINGITGVSSFNLTIAGNSTSDFTGTPTFSYINALQVAVVPEPSTAAFMILGGVGCLLIVRKRRRAMVA